MTRCYTNPSLPLPCFNLLGLIPISTVYVFTIPLYTVLGGRFAANEVKYKENNYHWLCGAWLQFLNVVFLLSSVFWLVLSS